MTVKIFADELQGPAWERIRAIRRRLYGEGESVGMPLDPDRVPPVFHHLMPYASLLTTGEEGALWEFFDALDQPTRDALMLGIEPLVDQLRKYGLDGLDGLRPRVQKPPVPPPERFDFSTERLHGMLDEVAARMKDNGPTPPEQKVMLDLARLYDLNEPRWIRPRSRSGR